MLSSTEGTTAYAANEGLTAVVNEHTDDVFAEAQPSPGTEANIGSLMDEDAEMVFSQNWGMNLIMEEEEPYDELGFDVVQFFHFYTLPWFFVTANEEIESIADIDEETQVSPTPEGSGTAAPLEHALSFATDDFDRVSYDFAEQASAMEEGRLEVGVGSYMNLEIEPGWLQEMGGTVDYHIPTIPDEVHDEWESDSGIAVGTFPGDEIETASGAPDEVVTPIFEYNFVGRQDLTYDMVYAFLEALHENREELGGYHEVLSKLEDEENFTNELYEDVPLHAAAYDYWDEEGLLNDDHERADDP
ncbi:TAXI family TRAP transporter solute-binding subunit [Natronorubrum sediminis]|nr:TAXI family TRAP transporter solute-binding subunit [Natronorubrum sediminis]